MPEISAEKPKIFEFFKIEKQGEILTVKLTSKRLDRSTASDFRRQLIALVKFKQPRMLVIDLAQLSLGDEILGPIFQAGIEMKISKENFILCEVSEITKDRLKRFGCEEILTII